MKYLKKPDEIEATQWFKNGDHPGDWQVPGSMLSREGKVVRYFRHPDIPDGAICEKCKTAMRDHGHIDQRPNQLRVCPGDFVVTVEPGVYSVVPADEFFALHEPPDEDKPVDAVAIHAALLHLKRDRGQELGLS